MKRILLLGLACPLFSVAQTTVFEENFDAYTAGNYAGVESSVMDTWSLSPGGADDALISDAQSSSPSNSVNIVGQSGPIDAICVFPEIYNAAEIRFSMKMYVVAGSAGYFNCQESTTPGLGWKCDVFFANNGTGYVAADGAQSATFNYAQDTWMDVVVEANLFTDIGKVFIDGIEVHSFTWSTGVTGGETYNRWGGMNYYAYGPNDEAANYYIDDLKLEDITDYTSLDEVSELDLSIFPNPSHGQFTFEWNNGEAYALAIFDVSGKLVFSANQITSSYTQHFNLESGTYIAVLSNEEEQIRKQLIVE